MKIFDKLERSKAFWSLFWISLLFFFLRLPSLIEPNWYGDEGIYQTIGMAINNGSMLYSGIWDNKPPFLYLIYALFNGDQFGTRVASLVVGLFSVWLFFHLSQKLFEKIRVSIITTALFAILFAMPLVEGNIANAENFMLLPIIAAAILIYKTTNKQNHAPRATRHALLTAGLLLSIAFLFKIVAIFDLVAFLCFLLIISLPKKFTLFSTKESRIKNPASRQGGQESWFVPLLRDSCFMILGFILPILITTLYFFVNHALIDFIRATFFGNIGYVGYANKFIIPQGFLILKLLLLAVFVLFISFKREKISNAAIFILIWIAFSLFNALFSQRPYTHYVLVLLPSFCLLIGLILSEKKIKAKNFFILIFIIIIAALFTTFKPSSLNKTILYYQNAFLFIAGKKDVNSYQSFFDQRTPRDYQLASFIKMHTHDNEPIFIWGDNAQIYALSKTFPINKYTVAYHIVQSKEGFIKTQKDINTIRPKYVIILSEAKAFPFRLTDYIAKFSLTTATIYERSF